MTEPNGSLEKVGEGWQLRYERRLPHSQAKVWRAISQPDYLEVWFPTEVLGDRTVGAELTFKHHDQDFPPMTGKMLRYEPPSVIEFTWGDDTLRFEVEPVDDGCRLTLTVGLAEQGRAARDGAGWHECLDLLGTLLDGGHTWPPGQKWSELGPGYAAKFGPAASTIGPPEGWGPPAAT